MLLEKLVEHAEQLDLPPPMYQYVPIRWLIDLDPNGRLLGFVPLSDPARRGARDRGIRLCVPDVGRTSGVKPKLLADNGEYVLGIARDSKSSQRIVEAHRQFRALVETCAKVTEEPSVWAVHHFLSEWSSADAQGLPKDFNPQDNLTFRVGETLPVDLPRVREFWVRYTAEASDTESKKPVMECVICGESKEVELSHPVMIKGIPGGRSSGMAMVSFNAGAFESYGRKKSHNSPTCRDCGERYAKAMNALIADRDARLIVGPVVFVFWTRGGERFTPVPYLRTPDPEKILALVRDAEAIRQVIHKSVVSRQTSATVKSAFESLLSGSASRLEIVDEDAFYAAALSASDARVVVRDWLETSVAEVKINLARWFALQRLSNRNSNHGTPLGVYELAASLYRDASEIPSQVPTLLIRTALYGGQLPDSILALAVRRNRAEQGITRNRATLIKLVLASQGGDSMNDQLAAVNHTHGDPAYHCGRLLAQLEEVQRRAIPGVKATITDRYFGSASSAPNAVFGVLIRNAQAHLSKLRKNNATYGTSVALEQEMREIMSRIRDGFPRSLDFRRQALFALGYYHQREDNFRSALAHKRKGEISKEETTEPKEEDEA